MGDWEGTLYGQNDLLFLLWSVPVVSCFVAEHRRSARMRLPQLQMAFSTQLRGVRRHRCRVAAVNLLLTPKSINAIPSMFFFCKTIRKLAESNKKY